MIGVLFCCGRWSTRPYLDTSFVKWAENADGFVQSVEAWDWTSPWCERAITIIYIFIPFFINDKLIPTLCFKPHSLHLNNNRLGVSPKLIFYDCFVAPVGPSLLQDKFPNLFRKVRFWHVYDNVFVETEAVKLKTIALRQYSSVFVNTYRFEYFEYRFMGDSQINTFSSMY